MWKFALFHSAKVSRFRYGLKISGPPNGSGALNLYIGLIPVIFYTYNGVIGKSPDWVNISIFFVAAAVSYLYELSLFRTGGARCKSQIWPFAVLFGVAFLFVLFTFAPPEIGIFRDPLTGRYGI